MFGRSWEVKQSASHAKSWIQAQMAPEKNINHYQLFIDPYPGMCFRRFYCTNIPSFFPLKIREDDSGFFSWQMFLAESLSRLFAWAATNGLAESWDQMAAFTASQAGPRLFEI